MKGNKILVFSVYYGWPIIGGSPLNLSIQCVLWYSWGVRGALNWSPSIPRDASILFSQCSEPLRQPVSLFCRSAGVTRVGGEWRARRTHVTRQGPQKRQPGNAIINPLKLTSFSGLILPSISVCILAFSTIDFGTERIFVWVSKSIGNAIINQQKLTSYSGGLIFIRNRRLYLAFSDCYNIRLYYNQF